MWLFTLLIICSGSLEFIVADEPRVLPQAAVPVQNLQYSPSLNSPLPYSPISNYASNNFAEKGLKVPSTQSEINRQFEVPQLPPTNCPQLETLESILVLLKRILNQNSNTYFTQPDKRIEILRYLKEFLEMSGSRFSEIEKHEKLNELIQRAYKSLLVDKGTSLKTMADNNHKNHVEANFIFKYEIPSINNVDCKEALATLIQTVKQAHLQLINYCNQSGKCNLNSETNPLQLQYGDKSNILLNSVTLGQPTPGEGKITVLDPNLSNSYSIQNSVNNLVNANNQILSQTDLNDFNHRSRPQLDLNGNQFLNTKNINSGIVQTLNNQEKNLEAFNNIYLNKKAIQSNQLHSDQSNTLNSFLSFHEPVPAQAQIPPSDPNPLNIHNIQSPLNNLVAMPYIQGDPIQKVSTGFYNLQEQSQPYLNRNQLLVNGALNAGIVETDNKLEKNIDISNNKYLNILNGNDLSKYLSTPTSGIKYYQTYNPIPFVQNPQVQRYLPTNYNNDINQQLYKLSETHSDNRQSMAFNNQNKQDIKEQIQYNTASVPNHQYYNLNSWPYVKPNEVKTFASPDLTLTNPQVNFGKFQNQNMGLISPPFHSSLQMEQNPYLNSINLNQQNSLNYNSQQADASVQSNYGLNLYTTSNLADYAKHDIYGNKLFDSNRLASASNLVKLNSAADNDEVIELTYKLKRPHSGNYNPYYYLKFRMPYRDFVSKVTDLTRNQNVRSDPLKLHQELLSLSNLKEASPDLKTGQHDDLSKLVLNNGGTLINAQVLGTTNDTKANEYLKTIQNLNANLNTNEILNFVEHDKSYNQPMSLGSDIPASVNTLQPQYIQNLQQRRLIPGLLVPGTRLMPSIKPLPLTFLPATSQMVLNPEIPQTMYTAFN